MATRRRTRGLALQALYEADSSGHKTDDILDRLKVEHRLDRESDSFIHELVDGIARHRDEIDARIKEFATAWPLEQLPLIDRNILRLAIFEILHDNKAPIKVAINEAVELAKKFGSDSCAKFINGVLSSVSTLTEDR